MEYAQGYDQDKQQAAYDANDYHNNFCEQGVLDNPIFVLDGGEVRDVGHQAREDPNPVQTDGAQEPEEIAVVPLPYSVVEIRTVVVKDLNSSVSVRAMRSPFGPPNRASCSKLLASGVIGFSVGHNRLCELLWDDSVVDRPQNRVSWDDAWISH